MLSPLGVFLPAELLLARECCKPGDLLEIDRKLYAHWAVYVGNDEVVHLPETRNGQVSVVRCSLETVAQDCLVRVNNKQVPAKERGLTELPRDIVVANAIGCVGSVVSYNIVVSNSEHFVTQLKYGVGWSDQAKAMRHSMSSLSPSPSSPKQVAQAHVDIWSEITTILSASPPISPSHPHFSQSQPSHSPSQPIHPHFSPSHPSCSPSLPIHPHVSPSHPSISPSQSILPHFSPSHSLSSSSSSPSHNLSSS